MGRPEQLAKLLDRVFKRRDEVFETHRISEEAQRYLSEPDIESEENAQKRAIAEVLERLDEREREEVEEIVEALGRIELGEYGSCEVCGKGIALRRLSLIPWTPRCSKHAKADAEPRGRR